MSKTITVSDSTYLKKAEDKTLKNQVFKEIMKNGLSIDEALERDRERGNLLRRKKG